MAYYTRPEEALVDLRDRLRLNKEALGFKEVYLGEDIERLEFPSLQIIGDPAGRDIEGTQQFKVVFLATIWIYHADLMVGHEQRTIDDMKLATKVVQFLHQPNNRRLTVDGDDKLIFSYIMTEIPGRIKPEDGPSIIATRLTWTGETRVPFSMS